MSTSALPLPEQVAARVQASLTAIDRAYRAAGRSLRELGAASELADRMVATVPRPPAPAGPRADRFYSAARVADLLGVPVAEVAALRDRRALLGVRADSGAVVYPTFQFGPDGRLRPGLASLLARVPGGDDGDLRLLCWMQNPQAALGGRTPLEWLVDGGDAATLVDAPGAA